MPVERCLKCGFAVGEPVKMVSGLTPMHGGSPAMLRGKVEAWKGGCHIVAWPYTSTATALPNPNVELDDGWTRGS